MNDPPQVLEPHLPTVVARRALGYLDWGALYAVQAIRQAVRDLPVAVVERIVELAGWRP